MWIYFNYTDGNPTGLAFRTETKAVEGVVEKIEEYLGLKAKKPSPKKSPKKVPYARLANAFSLVSLEELQQQPAQPYQAVDDIGEDRPVPVPEPMNAPSHRYPDLFVALDLPTSSTKDQGDLNAIKEQIAITNTNKTIDNAKKLIELYDAYMKNQYGINCPLHTIQEIGIVDAKV
jgi:hypothetical protein